MVPVRNQRPDRRWPHVTGVVLKPRCLRVLLIYWGTVFLYSPVAIADSDASYQEMCSAVLSAASACQYEASCNEDTSMYLSVANRSAIIAMEGFDQFSQSAFDKYCIKACTSHSGEIDVEAFSRDVCGIKSKDQSGQDTDYD